MHLTNVLIPTCVRGFDLDAERFDVDMQNGTVAQISRAQIAPDSIASGTLLPCLVDAHVHIDKTYVVDEVGAADGDLFKAITLMGQHRASWTTLDITMRMQRAVSDAYRHGTRALRTHLDWFEPAAPKSLAAFEAVRGHWRGKVALQCVSLTPLDVFDGTSEGNLLAQRIAAELARVDQSADKSQGEAALMGAFVYRNADMPAKLQRVFEVAAQHGLHLDFHVDEGLDIDATGLRLIAELTLANQYQGKVTCGHCCSLSVQPRAEAEATLKLCFEAGVSLIALPTTNLYLQGAWDSTPVERGITRLNEAAAHGMQASIATDNVADSFFPYGSYDLLATYALGVQVAHLSPATDALATVTTHPARAMRLPWNGLIQVGCPADLVLLAATTPYELLSAAGQRRQVIRAGEMLAAG